MGRLNRCYVDPYLHCGTCHQCRKGRIDVCTSSALRGYFALHTPGGFDLLSHYPVGALSEMLLAPTHNIALLPDSISLELAACFGYPGTSFGTLKKAATGPGKTLLINGVTGTLGYAAVAVSLGLGVTKILGIGRNKEHLAEILSLAGVAGKNRISVASTEELEGDLFLDWISKEMKGQGPDILYDCLGSSASSSSTSQYISTIKAGGCAVLAAGGSEGDISFSYREAMGRDVVVHGSLGFSSKDVDEIIALIDAGVIDLSYIKHETFGLEDVNTAFERVGKRSGGATNVVVQPQK